MCDQFEVGVGGFLFFLQMCDPFRVGSWKYFAAIFYLIEIIWNETFGSDFFKHKVH
jgi:hypothetical protein